MEVPWIAVCTDAQARRPGHPILDAGRPHPRTYGSTARVLGTYVRERGTVALETAVAKLSGVPAARLGLRDRGVLREGAFADLVAFDPATVADDATYEQPSRHPIGIEHVVVNGRLAVPPGRRPASAPACCCGEADDGPHSAASRRPPRCRPSRHSPAGPSDTRCGIRPGRVACAS